jgi:hypothetical protein
LKNHLLVLLGASLIGMVTLGACGSNDPQDDAPLADAGADTSMAKDGNFGAFDGADGNAGCAIGCSASRGRMISAR